ncbi:Vacuolar-sorting protein SNF8 [Spironucleus salmonicida]|uniref:Vacuolar-sorting protein SNF8 n=1 Tax=Spironucleus salmonicida TaxID=348837 RepID=V6LC21_9EUKA|nr:Vacuolar-sorting protein SNF8 [Spironucleus salmonicida]|eukprot:EST41778.1 Vacuolar-sorting protein SNF8 [Spironucleus salmonicida]
MSIFEEEREQNQQDLKDLTQQLQTIYYQIKEKMQQYLNQNYKEIENSPQFRNQFFSLCTSLGVDPLQNPEGVEKLANFYYKLATRLLTSFIEMEPITAAAKRLNSTAEDVEKAVEALKCFGNLQILAINDTKLLSRETNPGASQAVQIAQKLGKTHFKQAELEMNNLDKNTIHYLLNNGIYAIDCQCENGQLDPDFYLMI